MENTNQASLISMFVFLLNVKHFSFGSGILIRSLADATQGHQFLSLQQIIYDAIGFCVAVAATAAVTIYAKRTLQKLQTEEELE